MRILHVSPTFPPSEFGGIKIVSFNLSKALAKRGHEVTVYTTDANIRNPRLPVPPVTTIEGMKIRYFRNLSNTFAFKYRLFIPLEISTVLKKEITNFDIIHIHEFRGFLAIIIHHYAKKFNIPYILQAHGSLPRIGKKGLKWIYDTLFGYKVLRDASKVIALNKVEAEQYRNMGVPEEKIAIIPNGIDLSEYANLPPKGQFKKKFNIPEDKGIVLYLGRIHRIKGIDILVKAYAYLTKKMNFKDAVLVIVGPDDGYLSDVKSLVRSLGVSNSVLFTGPLYGRDKLEAYVDSDVYVMPSRYETFPMGLLEAYACGKPVIASNVSGLKELVINGETDSLFEAGNVEQLADRLLYLLNHDKEGKDMGKKARDFVQERYSIEKVITKLERLYEEIAIK